MSRHPDLIVVMEWPADPKDITLEHAQALCGGDVKVVLRDIVRECLALEPSPEPVEVQTA